ncbi:MAG: bifunctional 5,10-methylenetetrahydrofolate dehydrogenase/5,10-methenyltetrahydrofolate cyclohydrolase [Planctomycetes bacterium]|nr:bifunctional 5,10-methylenetetrahydrofolate dehydrogenase/5,10-methenyltetrahydrofolate cyclohydrolase [Planctomycetota bacterium]
MARLIDGKEIAANIRTEVAAGIQDLTASGRPAPLIVAVEVGHDEASASYTRNQGKTARKLGLEHRLDTLPATCTMADFEAHLTALAVDPAVTGIMIQMPLPDHLDANACRRLIPIGKDVEAVTETAAGQVLQNSHRVAPCTAMAALRCLQEAAPGGIAGLDVVVVGRSAIVGRPLAMLLLHANATVTVCHTRTRDLAEKLRRADVVIAAVGRAGVIGGDMIKEGAICIDVGTNWDEASGGLVGDMRFAEVEARAAAITPVPGGVGPVTVAMLMANALRLAQA